MESVGNSRIGYRGVTDDERRAWDLHLEHALAAFIIDFQTYKDPDHDAYFS